MINCSYGFLLVLLQLGKREEEQRDMARCALRDPWWSLKDIKQVRCLSISNLTS
jgi:hypothetical protein